MTRCLVPSFASSTAPRLRLLVREVERWAARHGYHAAVQFSPRTVIKEHSLDAVVIVPGIMGSALQDRARGTIWGFRDPKAYLSLWGPGAGMTSLALTEEELTAIATDTYDPATARVQPAGLIRFSAFAPVTGGFEPYTAMVNALKGAAAHRDAVLEFAYDWRLPTRLNSRLLAAAMKAHLMRWRRHEAHTAARRAHPQQRDGQIVIVAHSMGGLVARGLGDAGIENGFGDVRQVITLGTPFFGSVKAAVMLARGWGSPVPLPRERLRAVATTMPGLYDLLPRTRCLLTAAEKVAALSVKDVVEIGGVKQLAEASRDDFEAARTISLPDHRPIVGVAQPTWQSLAVTEGIVVPANYGYRFASDNELVRDSIGRPQAFDDQGDGTVWRYAARPAGAPSAQPIAQQHGAMAQSRETIKQVVSLVTDQGDLGVRLGEGCVGLEVPDVITTNSPLTVTVSGEPDPAAVSCRIVDVATNELKRRPTLRRADNTHLYDEVTLTEPGLYRVEAKGKGEQVTQIVMVSPPQL